MLCEFGDKMKSAHTQFTSNLAQNVYIYEKNDQRRTELGRDIGKFSMTKCYKLFFVKNRSQHTNHQNINHFAYYIYVPK
jgi:hypothetical protein